MKKLKIYFKSREKGINLLLKKPRRLYTSNTFHELRVEIKKLNALLELINYCSKDFKRNKTFKPFKQIFKQAGNVRDFQIEEAMLKKYFNNNLIKEYRQQLKKLRLKEQNDYFSSINKNFSEKLKNKFHKIIPFLGQVPEKKVKQFIDEKKNKLAKLLNNNTLLKPQAHEFRKQLKSLNYSQKILNLGKQNETHQKKDSLLELLGKWNDCQITVLNLKKAVASNVIKPSEEKQLKKITQKIVSDSEILFYLINEVIAKNYSTKEVIL